MNDNPTHSEPADDDPPSLMERAIQAHQRGRLDEAQGLYERLLAHQPTHAHILHLLGLVHAQKEDYTRATDLFERAALVAGEDKSAAGLRTDILSNLGNALLRLDRFQEAGEALEQACAINPNHPGVHNNLGILRKEQDDLDEAIGHFRKALAIVPDYVDAWVNLGNALKDYNCPDESLGAYDRALTLNPSHAGAHSNRSAALLSLGRFREGWRDYEWRWESHGWPSRPFSQPVWEGEPLPEGTLLVYAEQGIGDEIMFASCLPDLAERVGHVVWESDPRLVPLLRRSFPTVTVHDGQKRSRDLQWLRDLPPIDRRIAAGSLPMYLRPDLEAFPHHKGYLVADAVQREQWRGRLADLDPGLRVGISWRGGHDSQLRKRRSVPLDHWDPLFRLPGLQFINLQYGDCAGELALAANHGMTVHHWPEMDPLTDLEGFAALIAELDLVISVDNSTVHMAGALGQEVWILQPLAKDWRWLRGRSDSYWYPRIRQFEQSEPGQWTPVMESAAAALTALSVPSNH